MRYIISILLATALQSSEVEIMVFGLSKHVNNPGLELNEANPGLGIVLGEKTDNTFIGLAAGAYKDSYNYTAKFVAASLQFHMASVGNTNVQCGALLGVVQGSTYNHNTQMIVLPNVRVTYERWNIHVGASPVTYEDEAGKTADGVLVATWLQYAL
jgi:hypothetical protein